MTSQTSTVKPTLKPPVYIDHLLIKNIFYRSPGFIPSMLLNFHIKTTCVQGPQFVGPYSMVFLVWSSMYFANPLQRGSCSDTFQTVGYVTVRIIFRVWYSNLSMIIQPSHRQWHSSLISETPCSNTGYYTLLPSPSHLRTDRSQRQNGLSTHKVMRDNYLAGDCKLSRLVR